MVEVPLEPVEMSAPPPAPMSDEQALLEEDAVVHYGTAGMGGGTEPAVMPSATACDGLAKLAARDGTITFNWLEFSAIVP